MGATEHEGSSIAPQDAARAADPQPRSPGPRRRRPERSSSSRRSGSRRNIRAGYFALAAIWGCLAGTGVLVVGLSSFDHPVRLDERGIKPSLETDLQRNSGRFNGL